jgi:hypothetical protein
MLYNLYENTVKQIPFYLMLTTICNQPNSNISPLDIDILYSNFFLLFGLDNVMSCTRLGVLLSCTGITLDGSGETGDVALELVSKDSTLDAQLLLVSKLSLLSTSMLSSSLAATAASAGLASIHLNTAVSSPGVKELGATFMGSSNNPTSLSVLELVVFSILSFTFVLPVETSNIRLSEDISLIKVASESAKGSGHVVDSMSLLQHPDVCFSFGQHCEGAGWILSEASASGISPKLPASLDL